MTNTMIWKRTIKQKLVEINKLYFYKKNLSFSYNQFILIQIRKEKKNNSTLERFLELFEVFSILHYKLGIKYGFCKGKKVKRKLY